VVRSQPAKSTPEAPRSSLIWLLGLLCGALATLATPMALLLSCLLAPGLVALAIDAAPGRPVARAMLLGGLAASVTPARELWLAGDTLPHSIALLSNPLVLGAAWAVAAVGWLLAEIAPLLLSLVIETQSRARAASLRAARARLEEEWGLPPAAESE